MMTANSCTNFFVAVAVISVIVFVCCCEHYQVLVLDQPVNKQTTTFFFKISCNTRKTTIASIKPNSTLRGIESKTIVRPEVTTYVTTCFFIMYCCDNCKKKGRDKCVLFSSLSNLFTHLQSH